MLRLRDIVSDQILWELGHSVLVQSVLVQSVLVQSVLVQSGLSFNQGSRDLEVTAVSEDHLHDRALDPALNWSELLHADVLQ